MEPSSPALAPRLDMMFHMWSKLSELHVFHDTLKQERLRRFMPLQLGLMAGFALSVMQLISPQALWAVPDIGYRLIWFTFCVGFCYMVFNYARRTMAIDTRNAEYSRTIKNQLRHFEQRLKPLFGDVDFLPYEGMYKVLNEHSVRLDHKGDYTPARAARTDEVRIDHMGETRDLFETGDPAEDEIQQLPAETPRSSRNRRRSKGRYFPKFTHIARPAGFHEARILEVVSWTWVASFGCLLLTSVFVFEIVGWR